jgi:sporulation protein YlmC with PRC-barrel domain
MDREIERVVPLEELRNYAVARGEPDVRGWDVIAGDGTRIGEVDELLVDKEAKKVRFLDVTVDEELVRDADTTQRVIIPIGSARLEEAEDQVFIDGVSSSEIFLSDDRRDDDRDRDRQPDRGDDQRADAPVVERERAIVELDPPARPTRPDQVREPTR